MQVLTIVVEVSMFKILKILQLFCLKCNGLNSFCYLMASVCVVALCTIGIVLLRRAEAVK